MGQLQDYIYENAWMWHDRKKYTIADPDYRNVVAIFVHRESVHWSLDWVEGLIALALTRAPGVIAAVMPASTRRNGKSGSDYVALAYKDANSEPVEFLIINRGFVDCIWELPHVDFEGMSPQDRFRYRPKT